LTTWTPDELTRIGDPDELEVTFLRPDDALGGRRTTWVVRDGDDL